MKFFLTILFVFVSLISKAYFTLSGYVYGSDNQPIPYVNVFIKNTSKITTTDLNGRYYFELDEGTYEIIFKMLGYEDRVLFVTIQQNIVKNIWLEQSVEALDEVVVKVSKKDPAYDIIKSAIEHKSKYLNQYEGYSTNFYIKATEIQEKDSSRLKASDFLKEDSIANKTRANMNLVESKGRFHFQQPDKVKEIVDGYNVKGSEQALFFLSNTDANFNFYNNLIYSTLTEAPLISPLNWTSVVVYKFKLLETYNWEGKSVYRIAVIPRKNGNALFEGEIHIVEDDWSIKKVDLKIDKKAMNYYNVFNIVQDYTSVNDSIWFLKTQDLKYETRSGKDIFKGRTVAYYDSIVINPVFKKRFFGVEVGVKTQQAYDRDSSYWQIQRPEPLTHEEQKYVTYIDSIQGVRNSDWYKDSIQRETNKILPKNILWFGQDYVNWRKQKRMYFAPVANMFDPVSPGGFRFMYFMVYSKKFEKSKRHFWLAPNASYGIRNEDLKGSLSARFLYDPYHIRQFYGMAGRQFNLINPYDAYINMFRRSNFFEQDFLILGHRMELINGLYLNTSFEYADRKAIANYQFGDLSDQVFENNTAIAFDPYTAFSTQIGFDYTPRQKYIREPNEKIVLGSKWPTLSVEYHKGYNNVFNSAVKFDRLEFGLQHEHRLGVFGTTKWRVEVGKFLDTTNLKQVDYKFMRQGDPLLYTNPYTTYQLLSYTFPVYDWYVEWHHLHRFNGVIMNKLPFVRKLSLRFVAGDGILFAPEQNFRHVELFAGVERVFRFWRERFRLGFYYAVAESSVGFSNGFKISIELYDKQSEEWNF